MISDFQERQRILMAPDGTTLRTRQPSLPSLCPITEAVKMLSTAGADKRGAIFTRREVVNFILDLAGYGGRRKLHKLRLLEPSFGEGDFLLPAIERLMIAWKRDRGGTDIKSLTNCIHAVELHSDTYERTRQQVVTLLLEQGVAQKSALYLADNWLKQGDFLLADIHGQFDVVVGNPPYVRQELIPNALLAEYRSLYSTMFDRADLYVPFIERGLSLLSKEGLLGFICADRWMKNRYGAPLRELVAREFHLKFFIDMVDTPAFHSDVIAYPAITVIGREKIGPTRLAHRPQIGASALKALTKELMSPSAPTGAVKEIERVVIGSEPWILEAPDQLAIVRRLESQFPTIEGAGCKVGIGVATGADAAFIGPIDQLDVESDRKLPLVMTRDIDSGMVKWRGYGVINPFTDEGPLVDLRLYPRLKKYLESRKQEIAGRHVAQKIPANWYRTIDRIYPALARKPKLLIPDIKGDAHIVFENGKLYPHHNLYYITSDSWDLRALQAVLVSGIARLFVSTYSTKMRGGYFRFQAQYLRRIRLPNWGTVPDSLKRRLITAASDKNVAACNRVVFEVYGLTESEQTVVGGRSS